MMTRAFKYCFFLLSLILCQSDQLFSTSTNQEEDVILTVHNVGQGNCVVGAIGNEIIIIDAGSSSHKSEWAYTKNQSPTPEKENMREASISTQTPSENSPSSLTVARKLNFTIGGLASSPDPAFSPEPDSSVDQKSPESMKSLLCTPDFEKAVNESEQEWRIEKEIITQLPKTRKDIAENVRSNLIKGNNNSIIIKTIVVTHPDQDHYNLLPSIIKKEDSVSYIILSGLPEGYFKKDKYTTKDAADEKRKFKEWLIERLQNETIIYFPAVDISNLKCNNFNINLKQKSAISLADFENIEGEKKTILEECLNFFIEHSNLYAPHTYGDQDTFLNEAFRFKLKNVRITPLSINPMHAGEPNRPVARLALPKDSNSDSLVLKVEYKGSSALLMGDATGPTTNRIESNYFDKVFLKTNVLLASHHCAESHGSNDKHWIELTQPEWVAISNGHLHGHPKSGAYENLKISKLLKCVQAHKILVGNGARNPKEGFLHITERAIFSTLNSGWVTARLIGNGQIDFSTERHGKIEEIKKSPSFVNINISEDKQAEEDEDRVADVEIEDENDIVTAKVKSVYRKIRKNEVEMLTREAKKFINREKC